MPNPKVGTVAMDVAQAVKNAKSGQARYRKDKEGVIHTSVGKIDFETNALKENIDTLLGAVKKAKPNNAKGIYFKKITVSSTMGAGLMVDMSSLAV
jgi:large subunit ribosomal protein L1